MTDSDGSLKYVNGKGQEIIESWIYSERRTVFFVSCVFYMQKKINFIGNRTCSKNLGKVQIHRKYILQYLYYYKSRTLTFNWGYMSLNKICIVSYI